MKHPIKITDNSIEFLDEHEASEIEEKIWWKAGRRYIFEEFLKRAACETNIVHILDIGCGSGAELNLLSKYGTVSGVERSPILARRARNRKIAKKIYETDFMSFETDRNFDLVCLIDMLEHNEDDDAVLKHINRQSGNKHMLLICVPACQFLFSQHDIMLNHYRRYSKLGMKKLMHKNNYQVIMGGYFFFFLFPFAAISRLKERVAYRFGNKKKRANLCIVPRYINKILLITLKLEAYISRFIQFPFGLWFIVLAKKQ